jgi:phosphorylase kinase alpha/beta subunit
MFELGHKPIEDSPLLQLIFELNNGHCNGVSTRVGTLFQLMLTAATERIGESAALSSTSTLSSYTMPISAYLPLSEKNTRPLTQIEEQDLERQTNVWQLLQALRASDNLYEQIELLNTLSRLETLDYDTAWGAAAGQTVTLAALLQEIYTKAGRLELWAIVRRAAGLLQKIDIGLSDAVDRVTGTA